MGEDIRTELFTKLRILVRVWGAHLRRDIVSLDILPHELMKPGNQCERISSLDYEDPFDDCPSLS